VRDNRLLRMLTVVLLATWSPGTWCCCHARAAEPALAKAHHSTCCTAHEAAAAMPAVPAAPGGGRGNDCCSPLPTKSPSCGCQHGAAVAALSAATTVPVTDDARGLDLGLLVSLPPALGAATTPGRLGLTCRGSPRCPPARSLLTLHCMLTV
jgi:hypothetical protein